MRHLNYNHLLYFWAVAREGSITAATKILHLTPQTISGQLKLLEDAVGEALFERAGRGLVLTDVGHLVFDYADEIFTLGEELAVRMKSGDMGMPTTLKVGLVNAIPKLIGMRVLQPALLQEPGVHLVCREGSLDGLLGELAVHQLDLVLSDCSLPVGMNVRAYNHKLGDSPIGFFVSSRMARQYRSRFPDSMNGAPLLLPLHNNPIRRGLEEWFETLDITPRVVAEFEDSALMKAFGEEGHGIFPAPVAIQAEVELMYKCRMIGTTTKVRESYYAISPERKLKHPRVLEIINNARELFSP